MVKMEGKTLDDWKIKISILWLLYGMVSLGYGKLGRMEGIIEQNGPEVLLLAAVVGVVQMTMSFLSLALKNPANCLANIIVGASFAMLELFPLGEAVAKLSA